MKNNVRVKAIDYPVGTYVFTDADVYKVSARTINGFNLLLVGGSDRIIYISKKRMNKFCRPVPTQEGDTFLLKGVVHFVYGLQMTNGIVEVIFKGINPTALPLSTVLASPDLNVKNKR